MPSLSSNLLTHQCTTLVYCLLNSSNVELVIFPCENFTLLDMSLFLLIQKINCSFLYYLSWLFSEKMQFSLCSCSSSFFNCFNCSFAFVHQKINVRKFVIQIIKINNFVIFHIIPSLFIFLIKYYHHLFPLSIILLTI